MYLKIPNHLCELVRDGTINTTEAFLLAMVLGFENTKQKECNVQNRYFADHLNMKTGSVKNMIVKLKKQGLLEVHFVDSFRTLKTTLSKSMLADSDPS